MLTTSMPGTRSSRSAIRWGWSARSPRESSAIAAGASRASSSSRPTRRSIPGNSGGPLFNQRGEVIGVTSRGFHAAFADNLGFAIPVSYVKEFIHHREAFAFDKANPNSGFRYLDPPRRQNASQPEGLKARASGDKKAAESSGRACEGPRARNEATRSRNGLARGSHDVDSEIGRLVGHRRRRARLGAWREVIGPRHVCRRPDQLPRPVSEGCLKRSFI